MWSCVVLDSKSAYFLVFLLPKVRRSSMLIEMNIMELKLLPLTWQTFGNNSDQALTHQRNMGIIEIGTLIWFQNSLWLMVNLLRCCSILKLLSILNGNVLMHHMLLKINQVVCSNQVDLRSQRFQETKKKQSNLLFWIYCKRKTWLNFMDLLVELNLTIRIHGKNTIWITWQCSKYSKSTESVIQPKIS